MPKLIMENDDGTRDEYATFFAILAKDIGNGANFRTVIGMDCRILVAGGMLKEAMIKSSIAWDEFIKREFPSPPLAVPDIEALQFRIKYSTS